MTETRERPATGLDSYFKLGERGTSVGTEVRAGFTTFLVMAYIIFVNPGILSNMPGADPAAIGAATALVAGLLTIVMGVVANVPIAMAAGLGINAAVAFGLVLGQGLTPEGAMGVIVIEGLVVALLVLVGLREAIMNAVPMSLKRAIGVGIGLFILFIGFVNGGLIGVPEGGGTPVDFFFPNTPGAWVTLIGLLITVVLYARKVPGALIISILLTTVVAMLWDVAPIPETFSVTPSFDTLGAFDMGNVFTHLGLVAALLTIFSFMLTDFFDTMGTATAIAEQADLVDENGNVRDIGKLLFVDSLGAAAGGAAGVSSNTSYIESSAGVAEGGRTGLTSVVVGVLFLLAIFVSPLAGIIPAQATAPVLILVGFLMAGLIKGIDFEDMEEGFPALLTMMLMPLTFKITVGIGAGFVMYTLIKVVKGKARDVHPLMWVVTVAFLIYFGQEVLGAAISA
ncbi:MAG: NCS2 family permease [Actinobacteria bacterium]|nr:NCS2 family permease [Actinomycetota bacterium]MCI0544078.1 NCS2 family permease [Actinomycetota bacterium]MCI0679405.1 NCS2 family permease [Actinomycetota bacterium]